MNFSSTRKMSRKATKSRFLTSTQPSPARLWICLPFINYFIAWAAARFLEVCAESVPNKQRENFTFITNWKLFMAVEKRFEICVLSTRADFMFATTKNLCNTKRALGLGFTVSSTTRHIQIAFKVKISHSLGKGIIIRESKHNKPVR